VPANAGTGLRPASAHPVDSAQATYTARTVSTVDMIPSAAPSGPDHAPTRSEGTADLPTDRASAGRGRLRRRRRRRSTHRVIVAAVIRSVIVFVVLVLLSLWVLNAAAIAEAKHAAGESAEVATRVALAPFLTDAFLDKDPAAVAAFDDAARHLVELQDVFRLKVWSTEEEIVWADDERLIGLVFELEPDERVLFDTQGSVIGISSLDKDENVFELAAGETKLLEVYFGTATPSGRAVLVETYYSYDQVTALVDDYRGKFFPPALIGFAILALAQLPLAVSLVRRLNAAQRDHERLLRRAIGATDVERRRIVAEVHDGAVQDLIGVGFALAGKAESAPQPLGRELGELSASTMETVRTLRGMLSSIYPMSVPPEGWIHGIADLVNELNDRGVTIEIDVDDERLGHLEELFILRTAREALRNVIAHSGASRVQIRLSHRSGLWVLEVEDNGAGFDTASESQRRSEGHFGLTLLRDLATDAGSTVTITSSPGQGTRVRLDLAALS
jgi:two-component system, NarL family, sensor kinase